MSNIEIKYFALIVYYYYYNRPVIVEYSSLKEKFPVDST